MNSVLQLLSGTWFIISHNFPMWTDGSKSNPAFNYTISVRKGKTVLLDEVKYEKKGKTKVIRGFDYQHADNEKAFTWKGKGLLAIAKSEWEIRLLDEQNEWAVIWFSKTLFTPEGVDIISRKKEMDESTLEIIRNRMLSDSLLKKHIGNLARLK